MATQVWLELTDEYGGEAFGPLDGPEVRLGTAEDVDIQLGKGLGVVPVHARLVRKSPDTFYLSAAHRDAEVWLWRVGDARPAALHGPVVLRPGDGFSLGGPHGVRFRLVVRDGKAAAAPASAVPASEQAAGLAKGLGHEAWRRLRAWVQTTWVGQLRDTVLRLLKGWNSPVFLMGLLLAASGWGLAWHGWRGRSAAQAEVSASTEAVDALKAELESCRSSSGPETASLGELVGRVTGDDTLRDALAWPDLASGVQGRLRLWLGGASKDPAAARRLAAWLDGDRGPWKVAHDALAKAGLPEELAAPLAWTVVRPDEPAPRDPIDRWGLTPDGAACTRGPFQLSYAQARALGLDAVPDAFVSDAAKGAIAGEQVLVEVVRALRATETAATGEAPTVADDAAVRLPGELVPGGTCYALEGDDDRDDARAVSAALARALGPKAKGVPDPGLTGAGLARVLALGARHLGPDLVAKVDLRDGAHLDAALAALGDPHAGVVARAASLEIAASVALPCLRALAGGKDARLPKGLAEPDFEACAILRARAEADRWN